MKPKHFRTLPSHFPKGYVVKTRTLLIYSQESNSRGPFDQCDQFCLHIFEKTIVISKQTQKDRRMEFSRNRPSFIDLFVVKEKEQHAFSCACNALGKIDAWP